MFSWSNKDGSSGTRRSGSKQQQQHTHQQHISSFLTDPILKPSTRKVNDSTYDTVFQTKDHNALILRVHFPQSPASLPAPKMTLVGIRAVHPWIDSKMRVIGYDPIKSDSTFVKSGILLAKAVNDVVRHFQLHPPQQLVVVDAGLRRLQESLGQQSQLQPQRQQAGHQHNAATGPSVTHYSNNAHASGSATLLPQQNGAIKGTSEPNGTMPQPYHLPKHFREVIVLSPEDQQQLGATIRNLDIPSAPSYFEQFESMDRKTMTEMIDSPSTLLTEGGLAHHPLVEEILALKHTIMEANLQQAESNLKQEVELKTLYDDVKKLQSQLKVKVEEVNQLQRRQMELCKPMDKKKIIQRLKKGKKESFDESEDLAHDWLHGSSPGSNLDEFIDRFLEVRIVHHVRAAKMERLGNAQ